MIQGLRGGLLAALILMLAAGMVRAAPGAVILMDARDGAVLHQENADARLHPASLTKMMTLYLVFEALRAGRLAPDQKITVSAHAAAQPPSRLGLRAGQRIAVMDLVRAAAVKSANDAATALAEAVGGSEPAFGRMMTAKAAALGMRNSQFRNAHGLSVPGHYSSARDMAILGRRLAFDFPEYFGIFGKTSVPAMGKTLHSTNRLLKEYPGADGIKTGYTRAAGYNLVASAERGNKRMIAVVFGGRSSRSRNDRIADLLDMGFDVAPVQVAVVRPDPTRDPGVRVSARPRPRGEVPPDLIDRSVAAVSEAILPAAAAADLPLTLASAPMDVTPGRSSPAATVRAPKTADAPPPKPGRKPVAKATPPKVARTEAKPVKAEIWAIQLGAYKDRSFAQRSLSRAKEARMAALKGATPAISPTVVKGVRLFRAQMTGLSRKRAEAACDGLRRLRQPCEAVKARG